ncbi:tyrosine-protein phosphatase 10D-like isoform X1 [Daktulosphaira vitifoliae]|uniref:tyrosine-protein phosphatase 10D-like isoform X1 n=2 Tax=Daktulosphaira vitifoliae TaxID=58002 RepID=UPI0021AB0A29|nr:tyrosine-protein phosphatase 10D-like isoform X1 [Daktulosphaira vitifoliae]
MDKTTVRLVITAAIIIDLTFGADLAIQLPRQGDSSVTGGSYRLDYSPPYGQPPANTTIASRDIGDVIHFSQALPGTRYDFWLYYSNNTENNNWLLTWTASITTAPDPPTNLTVQVKGGKTAHVTWTPPASGNYDSFKLKINGLSSSLPASEQNVGRVILVPNANPNDSDKSDVQQQQAVQQYVLKDLTPGATYQVQLFAVYDRKESVAYISRNFTTKPSTPGKFIVWFRNETTLLVLWQPSYPASVFTHYKVSVEPPDSPESVLYVEREGEPPGPAQAAFKGLVPGRAYNISVHTVSEDETSAPTTAQYRTIPLRPTNLVVDGRMTGSYNVRVRWDPPKGLCEFDKYQISVNAVAAMKKSSAIVPAQQSTPITVSRTVTSTDLNHDIDPGRTYQVLVKTVSGKVASWPASVNVTLKPLPVTDLKIARVEDSVLTLHWQPDPASYQDAYQVAYTEVVSNAGAGVGQLPIGPETTSAVALPGAVLLQPQAISSSSSQQSSAGAADSNVIIVSAASQGNSEMGSSNNNNLNVVECTLDALLPGRNYSISVRALSGNGVGLATSNETIVYHTMKPSAPIIEDLRPTIDYGLNVSWKTDVNSRQETFQVVCRRNDTDDIPMVRITSEWRVSLKHLYPGAAYQIKVFAISHGLLSEPHDYFQAVYPRPPVDLQVENITATAAVGGVGSVLIRWNRPVEDGGVFTEYSIKYRTVDSSQWIRLPGVPPGVQEAEIADMTAGQRYTIQVNTQTYGALESPYPQQVNYTIRPNPITNVALLVDATNVTLTFPRPEGLLEYYTVQWWIVADRSIAGSPSSAEPGSGSITTAGSTGGSKNITDSAATSSATSSAATTTATATSTTSTANGGQNAPIPTISLSVDDLVPGARYVLRVRTTSHGLHSDYTQLTANTMPLILSEVLAVNDQHTTDTLTLRYTPTPQVASRFEKYRFQLASGSNSVSDDGDGKPTQSLIAEKLATDNEWKVTWQGLTPGQLYDITVWTVSAEGVLSQPLRRQDRLYPEPISELNATYVGRDSVTLAWRVPRGQYDAFQIQYLLDGDNDGSSSSSTSSSTLVQNLTVDPWFDVRGLRPYRNYTFTVVVRAGGTPPHQPGSTSSVLAVSAASLSTAAAPTTTAISNAVLRRSVPVSAAFATLESVPATPRRLIGTDVRPQQLTLEWTLPESEHNGVLLRFVVSWKEIRRPSGVGGRVRGDDSGGGDDDEDGAQTDARSPLAVDEDDVSSSLDGEKTVYLESWRNRVTIGGGSSSSNSNSIGGGGNSRGGAANAGLIPGKVYSFTVCGETRAGRGGVAQLRQRMPILAPPKPSAQAVPTEVSRTKQTIQVRFRKNYFSEMNGAVLGYTVIVAEDDGKNASGLEMPSWRDVQAYSTWPPYQVLEPYTPFSHNKTVEDFTIGQDQNCNVGGNYNSGLPKTLSPSGYCNGPLKPATVYRVKIRAFTSADKFTDTSYSFPIQTDQDVTSSTGTTAAIAFIVIFVLVLSGAAVAAYSKYKNYAVKNSTGNKRNDANGAAGQQQQQQQQQRRNAGSKFFSDSAFPTQRNTLLGGPELDSLRRQGSCDLETSRPVRADRFIEHYAQMSADSDFRFSEEFEELKHVGRQQPCAAADLPCNRPKNRFTNILPYDHSRFKLQPVDDEEGSDYINANYVPGHNSVREFIVTQGPLHSTRDDFWRMCWESGTRSIVMLTRCVEKGREKCDHYWPYDTQPTYYGGGDGGDGGICVTLLNDTHYADYVITEFMVCRNDQKRVIRHFHFTTWPDFGVPSPPQTLCRFVRAFRDRINGGSAGMNPSEQSSQHRWPVIVHCSAGVGRSGTFIALDRVLQSIQDPHRPGTFLPPHVVALKYVDVYGIVYAMRKERVWMVQTEQQYICIHQCVVSVLQSLFSSDQQQSKEQQYQYGGGQYRLGCDGVDDEDLIEGGTLMITGVAHHNRAFEDDEGIAESGM